MGGHKAVFGRWCQVKKAGFGKGTGPRATVWKAIEQISPLYKAQVVCRRQFRPLEKHVILLFCLDGEACLFARMAVRSCSPTTLAAREPITQRMHIYAQNKDHLSVKFVRTSLAGWTGLRGRVYSKVGGWERGSWLEVTGQGGGIWFRDKHRK